jgi:hypothetical protein
MEIYLRRNYFKSGETQYFENIILIITMVKYDYQEIFIFYWYVRVSYVAMSGTVLNIGDEMMYYFQIN